MKDLLTSTDVLDWLAAVWVPYHIKIEYDVSWSITCSFRIDKEWSNWINYPTKTTNISEALKNLATFMIDMSATSTLKEFVLVDIIDNKLIAI